MFDSATRQICTVKTAITNTPLHALTLLNDVTYIEAARGLAGRMAEGLPRSRKAPWRTGSRSPPGVLRMRRSKPFSSTVIGVPSTSSGPIPRRAQAYVGIPDPQFAAYTRTAQVILNLDETLNRN